MRLQLRLQRLDAMRDAGARLMGRDRLGRDVFARGTPEGLRLVRKSDWQVDAHSICLPLMVVVKARTQPAMHVVHDRRVMTLDDAIERVSRLIGAHIEWTVLQSFLPTSDDAAFMKSALASSVRRRARTGAAGSARYRPGPRRSRH